MRVLSKIALLKLALEDPTGLTTPIEAPEKIETYNKFQKESPIAADIYRAAGGAALGTAIPALAALLSKKPGAAGEMSFGRKMNLGMEYLLSPEFLKYPLIGSAAGVASPAATGYNSTIDRSLKGVGGFFGEPLVRKAHSAYRGFWSEPE